MTDKIYTEKEAKKLSRKQQLKILKERNIKISRKDKEKDLINKLIKSNPSMIPQKDVKVDSVIDCERCGNRMEITGGGHSGTDLHCPKCGLNTTRVI